MPLTIDRFTDAQRHELALDLLRRHDDLVAATGRWLTNLAADLDDAVARLAVVEDLVAARDELPPSEDELAPRRAQRALEEAMLELGGLAASLRLGPPPTVGYRLTALVHELEASAR